MKKKSKRSSGALMSSMLGRQVELTDQRGNPFRGTIINVYTKKRGSDTEPWYSVEFLPNVCSAWSESAHSRVLEMNIDGGRGCEILVPADE